MDFARKNQQIANSFYNLGLEKAKYGIYPARPNA